MRKISEEEFSKYLNAFAEGNTPLIHGAITLVTNDDLYSDRLSDVPRYMKSSLVRKVLRYVAQTSLKGTMEIDGLALSCSFHEMKDGDAVSFGTSLEWSFYSHRLKEIIHVEIGKEGKIARYYDSKHNLRMEVNIWSGCHWYESTGRIDLMHHFDDVRNPID